jgi:hypothetical protein
VSGQPSPVARFWSKVLITPGCWFWTGVTNGAYGRFRIGKKRVYAHIYSYELHHGPVPPGLEVRHRCHQPLCVNPWHLIAGTHAQNMADLAERRLAEVRPICNAGHSRAEHGTFRGTKFVCLACERARTKRYRERKAA